MPIHPDAQDQIDTQFTALNRTWLTDKSYGCVGDFSEFRTVKEKRKMSPHNLKIWAKISALMAQISGMNAENACYPENIPYGEKAFFEVQTEIERLSESFERE